MAWTHHHVEVTFTSSQISSLPATLYFLRCISILPHVPPPLAKLLHLLKFQLPHVHQYSERHTYCGMFRGAKARGFECAYKDVFEYKALYKGKRACPILRVPALCLCASTPPRMHRTVVHLVSIESSSNGEPNAGLRGRAGRGKAGRRRWTGRESIGGMRFYFHS